MAPPGPHSHPHRREAIRVPAVPPIIRRQEQPEGAPADTRKGQEVRLSNLQENLLKDVSPQQALGKCVPWGSSSSGK
ncbi:UNVERIFIED_CONTAM: hypothetical protein GTU68_030073 [Idotea baltica]|nr:hypothetical protein [Idotea baltica]